MNIRKKISFALAVLISVSVLATGCKKTDEETAGLADASVTTSISEITQMTTTTAAATTTTAKVTESETETEAETETTTEASSQTESETTTAATSAAATTTAATTAATSKSWSETEISEVMYTSQACYSRKIPVVGAETVAQYTKGTKVNVVAATDTGYYKLADGSFIHSDYLSDEKPAATTTAATTASTTAKTTSKTTAEETASADTSKINTSYNVDYTTKFGYKSLTKDEKTYYANLVEAIENLSTTAEVPSSLLDDDCLKVYGMVFNQEPQLFWMSTSAPRISMGIGSNTATISYEITDKKTIASMQKEIDTNTKSILASANKYTSTVSKLKVFYDWIIIHNEFTLSDTAATCGIYNGLTGSGGLQCVGYAKTMLYLCDLAGIEAMTITGENTEGTTHAWNIVYCEDGYYNLDTAWGDPINDHDSNYIRYNFFLVPDSWIKNDHLKVNMRTKSNGTSFKYFDPPTCTKTTYNYFKYYGKEFSGTDNAVQAMYDELEEAIKNKKNVAHIKVTDSDTWSALLSDSNAVKFQKYAQSLGASKLARQKHYTDGILVVQYDIFY